MDKVQTIEDSLRCFWRSFFGLIPIFGLPFAVHSVFAARRLRRDARGHWNPAGRYVNWGAVVGWIGIGITVLGCVLVTLIVIHQFFPGSAANDLFFGPGGD